MNPLKKLEQNGIVIKGNDIEFIVNKLAYN